MKTETIVAIVLGIIVGGSLAVFLASKVLTVEKKPSQTIILNTNQEESSIPTVASASAKLETFSIIKPTTNIKTTEDKIQIQFKSPIGSLIVIESPIYDKTITTTSETTTDTVPLSKGTNLLEITAYHKNLPFGVQSKQLYIYVLPN